LATVAQVCIAAINGFQRLQTVRWRTYNNARAIDSVNQKKERNQIILESSEAERRRHRRSKTVNLDDNSPVAVSGPGSVRKSKCEIFVRGDSHGNSRQIPH
jgi:hypothetical protein